MEKIQYSQEDYKFINSVENSIHRALWGEVVPSMRGIILKWKPNDSKVRIFFYHQGEITEAVESHYSSIMTEIDADHWEKSISCDYEIIKCDPSIKVPTDDDFIVYLRKEPFVDPE